MFKPRTFLLISVRTVHGKVESVLLYWNEFDCFIRSHDYPEDFQMTELLDSKTILIHDIEYKEVLV